MAGQFFYLKAFPRTPIIKVMKKKKNIKDITEAMESEHGKAVNAELNIDLEVFKKAYAKELKLDRSKVTKKKTKEGNVTEVKLHMSDGERSNLVYEKIIKIKEREMNKAVKELDFETAAILRDEIGVLRERIDKSVEA
jgi:excinuclease UvrABC helicase subunit UvrB